ncbi:methyl-accepting chemotaxis protein [Rhizobium skierniewicense]|uniref:Methyl-accepting chemotaxis protein n=1 Tax=Rhizobium skierniewicense TaxID=984260 RepID=A0A7W6C404_9HYPH|nr:CHASE3 domain-containing protein [Rhizobium skierniewicense]MBB3945323.1 methyl-accepting chemotaxis protein [Rhizobium skierniewicense]
MRETSRWSWELLRQDYLTTPTLLRSIPVGVVIAAGVVATTWTHTLLSDHQDMVVHTYEAIDTTKDVLIALDDAETGQRGYLVSSDRRYLDPYDKALGRLHTLQADLLKRISDNEHQVARVTTLNGLIDTKLKELSHSITLHDQNSADAARAQESTYMATATMDRIRDIIGDITVRERNLLETRQAEVDSDEFRIQLVAIILGLASFLTRAGVEIYLTRRQRAK